MKGKEKELEDRTFKNSVSELDERVFRTVTQDEKLADYRVAKLLAVLVKQLHAKGVLSEEDIDTVLEECLP